MDRVKYEKRVITESLQWRIENPSSPSFLFVQILFVPTSLISIGKRVRCVPFLNKFYDNKDDVDYSKYWNEPALTQVFKDLDKTNAALTRILIRGENADGSLTARMGIVPADVDNNINSVEYNGNVFKSTLKSKHPSML